MKHNNYAFFFGFIGAMATPFVTAASVIHSVPWQRDSGIAGTCISTASELAPLSVPKTLVVGNNVPNGTVLYQWGYDSFVPLYSVACQEGTPSTTGFVSSRFFISFGFEGYDQINRAHTNLNNKGVGLRLYYTQLSQGPITSNGNVRVTNDTGGFYNGLYPIGVEYELKGVNLGSGAWLTASGTTALPMTLKSNIHFFSSRWRAELVKIGDIDYSQSPLKLNRPAAFISADSNPRDVPFPNIIGGGGINIIPPSCRLAGPTTYSVNLGHWERRGIHLFSSSGSTSFVGEDSPIDINLECNDTLNNVQISFQDAGNVAQQNGSVGLYDTSGAKVSGLEAEIRYNGASVLVGTNTTSLINLSKTSVGTRTGGNGAYYDGRFFTNVTPAKFTARFVQRAPITRNGTPYAGLVSGLVNVFVTYN
ncbi:hypothetical protein [Aeromonas veronii]|uniref:hypothetical protein n=1 Tax=Aeromonas veronii TaxID=654 RepID=UPI00293709C9|nr:hypothetical protein [Aeromonas veronii]WOE87237.1 hypothetical protein RY930_23620 [Aeromonas veronii]